MTVNPLLVIYLESVDQWNQLRVVRNHFAHDYPSDDALKADHLNDAVRAVPTLEALQIGRAHV